MEGIGEGCGFLCSPKLPYLSTMSQQFCRRLKQRIVALNMDREGEHLMREEYCYFDGKVKRCHKVFQWYDENILKGNFSTYLTVSVGSKQKNKELKVKMGSTEVVQNRS